MINCLFLSIIFLIGLIISYQDFRYGKIKNKWIVYGFILGLGGYFLFWFLFIYNLVQITIPLSSYFLRVVINSGISLLVGFFIWRLNLWSAGDAKLFALFAFLLPLEFYRRSYLPYFPSFVLLLNIFIPILIFYLTRDIFYLLKLLTDFRGLKQNFRIWLITKKLAFDLYFKESQFEKIPFALWMLVGLTLTVILRGSIVSFLTQCLIVDKFNCFGGSFGL
jgi:Flp pilus assembly protein protease CpaA